LALAFSLSLVHKWQRQPFCGIEMVEVFLTQLSLAMQRLFFELVSGFGFWGDGRMNDFAMSIS